jgi:hypothetical protein
MFGNNDAKRQQKTKAILEKYGLQGLSDPKDQQAVYNLAYEMSGSALESFGLLLQGNTTDSSKLYALRALMEQNFIIIRQLDRISKLLEK